MTSVDILGVWLEKERGGPEAGVVLHCVSYTGPENGQCSGEFLVLAMVGELDVICDSEWTPGMSIADKSVLAGSGPLTPEMVALSWSMEPCSHHEDKAL